MVEVFRCVRDVLADDGTLWLNIGDSYAAQRGGTHMPAQTVAGGKSGKGDDRAFRGMGGEQRGSAHRNASAMGLKHKDLIGIPWMLAFALRADGWYLRQDIIWHKPNPMPESVRDRCTKAHEYMFLLSKSERYFYDAKAVREPEVCGRMRGPALHRDTVSTNGNSGLARRESDGFRNRRSVWTVTTRPYKGAHFATFPPALIEPCVLAGSRAGDAVLDPFMGSGTTAAVALQHGRTYLGCELNPQYGALQQERIARAIA
jgi:DNA modification methylase